VAAAGWLGLMINESNVDNLSGIIRQWNDVVQISPYGTKGGLLLI
jgi:hypothetical protein